MRPFRLVVGGFVLLAIASPGWAVDGQLSLEERIAAQRAIEEVYWRHRIWPADNPGPKPSFPEVFPEELLRVRVEDGLRKSAVLERYWRRPIGGAELRAEIERIARESRSPRVLRELFAALEDDPLRIAECLARPVLADRLLREAFQADPPPNAGSSAEAFEAWWRDERARQEPILPRCGSAVRRPA